MSDTTLPEPSRESGWLKRAEQSTCAVFVAMGLALMAASWVVEANRVDRRINIDVTSREPVQFQLDLNTADWPELALLPGIGETLAKRIVAYRLEKKSIRDISDLRNVHGIGPVTLERIRPYIMPLQSTEHDATDDSE